MATQEVAQSVPVSSSSWVIRKGYRYEAVEFVKETAQMIFYIERRWSGAPQETRSDKSKFLKWRGSEEAATKLVAQLTSAVAERDRRTQAAQAWFNARRDELIAGASFAPIETVGGDSETGYVAKP